MERKIEQKMALAECLFALGVGCLMAAVIVVIALMANMSSEAAVSNYTTSITSTTE